MLYRNVSVIANLGDYFDSVDRIMQIERSENDERLSSIVIFTRRLRGSRFAFRFKRKKLATMAVVTSE
ncbi:hypothetical protein [Ligilactobacillus acidipiscis]|uniref:hypothetical protein n=1 Tax=Ligilactobacillus acidipiscis TaxID=89059 RepID=UPI0022E2B460|nr:hypothetical protein [Ligilactobacillus acidipiscis]